MINLNGNDKNAQISICGSTDEHNSGLLDGDTEHQYERTSITSICTLLTYDALF